MSSMWLQALHNRVEGDEAIQENQHAFSTWVYCRYCTWFLRHHIWPILSAAFSMGTCKYTHKMKLSTHTHTHNELDGKIKWVTVKGDWVRGWIRSCSAWSGSGKRRSSDLPQSINLLGRSSLQTWGRLFPMKLYLLGPDARSVWLPIIGLTCDWALSYWVLCDWTNFFISRHPSNYYHWVESLNL